MAEDMDVKFHMSIAEMIQCCQDLHELLQEDKQFFVKDNFDLLEKSNQKKAEVMAKLHSLVCDMQLAYPSGLSEKIKIINQKMIQKLQSQVSECGQSIHANSRLVMGNIKLLNDLWKKVISVKQAEEAALIYDRTGQKV
ncbi:MAG: hypothetical protein ACYCQI_02880 [Gammaproteobacteria bacterium]